MFCIQCEQTLSNEKVTGCQFKKGKCGKESDTADLQDLLIYMLQGIGQYAHRARQLGAIDQQIDRFIPAAFFTTLTNVNFDEDRFVALLGQAKEIRQKAENLYRNACAINTTSPEALSGPALFELAATKEGMLAQAAEASIREDEAGPDVFGLRCLILFGLKGCAAYAEHALVLGEESEELFGSFHEYLHFIAAKPTDIDSLLAAAMGIGELNLNIMALLDQGSTSRFGHPEPTQVRCTPIAGKAILVSGHDLVDLEAILKQTEDSGINVYTHGELLPAHGYPALKAYSHLAGNYGGAWQDQQQDFAAFPGAIVMTSNCIIDPSLTGYADRIFTAGPVGWPCVEHIVGHDFSKVIEVALHQPGFTADLIEEYLTVGFGRNAVLNVADVVIDGVKNGAISHFFLVGGCDGADSGRNYYSDFADNAPDDSVILTLGCGKYRFNKKNYGDIGGIPRLLDVGQCNDAYSAIQIALALADACDCDVNDLPLTMIISWFEQKAAAVLLSLLYLGIKGIHLGPSLPQFLTPDLVDFLVENFDLKPTGDAQADIKNILEVA